MGVLMSKENSVLLENCEDASQSSPPSAVMKKLPHRFLPSELDPRSPSAGIDRTPIQIAVSSNLVDPRSPSCGIERTPIHVLPRPAVIPVLDPRSPTAGINRTPIVCYTTSQPSDVDDVSTDVIEFNDVPKFPAKDLDYPEVFKDSTDDKPTIKSCQALSDKKDSSAVESQPPTQEAKTCTTSSTTSSKSSCHVYPVPYALSPASNKIFGGSSSSGSRNNSSDSPRSPLAPRNFAGPRAASTPHGIVRRKQAFQVEKLRGSADSPLTSGDFYGGKRLAQHDACDKENM